MTTAERGMFEAKCLDAAADAVAAVLGVSFIYVADKYSIGDSFVKEKVDAVRAILLQRFGEEKA